MARLTNLKPRLASMGTRLSVPSPATERDRLHARDAANPWRSWYKTARWQKLRQRILLRDMYTCQKTGVLLVGKHPEPNSPVIHHGDEALFWDEDNLMAVSKEWHDREGQIAEQATLQQRGVWY